MRLKLDENLPDDARAVAESLGHDVDPVADEGLTGADDPHVLDAARREGRFVVTLDRGLGDIRRYPPGSHAGIAVIRIDIQDAPSVTAAVRSFLASEVLDDLAGCVVVVRGRLVRIRRPE